MSISVYSPRSSSSSRLSDDPPNGPSDSSSDRPSECPAHRPALALTLVLALVTGGLAGLGLVGCASSGPMGDPDGAVGPGDAGNQNGNNANGNSNHNANGNENENQNQNNNTGDRDGDGVPDDVDNCPDEPNNDQADQDGDGIGDDCDDDWDGDGVSNGEDNCPHIANETQADTDGDGDGDPCDNDDDQDGVVDGQDNCPLDYNPTQTDSDGDGVGDVCEDDFDGDGVLNAQDNCPDTPNPDQDNLDGDAYGDACDDDKDGDNYDTATDCDDLDASVNPAAQEACNGVDDNCDGHVDFPADPFETNDTASSAHYLGSMSDSGGAFQANDGQLSSPGDEDWFRFHDSDDLGGSIYPEAELTANPGGYTVCVYYECTEYANDGLSCDAGTQVSDGPSFAPDGCCSTGHVKLNHSCDGPLYDPDDSADLYVRVYAPGGNTTCDLYSVRVFDE